MQPYLERGRVYKNLVLFNLSRSCSAMENELEQLSKQKDVCLAEIGRLKTEEKSYRSQLSDLKSQVKEKQNDSLARKVKKADAKNFSSSARTREYIQLAAEPEGSEGRERLHLSNGLVQTGTSEVKAVKPSKDEATVEKGESESEEEEVDITAGSMDMAELGQPSLKPKVGVCVCVCVCVCVITCTCT